MAEKTNGKENEKNKAAKIKPGKIKEEKIVPLEVLEKQNPKKTALILFISSGVLFVALLVFLIAKIMPSWISWLVFGLCTLAALILAFVFLDKNKKRLEAIDKAKNLYKIKGKRR